MATVETNTTADSGNVNSQAANDHANQTAPSPDTADAQTEAHKSSAPTTAHAQSAQESTSKSARPNKTEQSGNDAAQASRDKGHGRNRRPNSSNSKKPRTGKRTRTRARRQEPVNPIDNSTMKLQRFLAATGNESRRNCEELIQTGRVTIDDKVITDVTATLNVKNSVVRLDGEVLRMLPRRYYLLNKPKGYLCTNKDPRGRSRAVDLIPDRRSRLFTVGRLDENSEGLLLVTNDGELANRLAHPRYHVRRMYRIQVAGVPRAETIAELKRGIHFADGFFKVHGYKRLRTKGKSAFLEIELNQGRNREIRRLFARVGHKVIHLQRVSFGPLKLGRLGPGKSRPLSPTEIKQLLEFVESRTASPPTRHKSNKKKYRGKRDESAQQGDAEQQSSRTPRNKVGRRGVGKTSGGAVPAKASDTSSQRRFVTRGKAGGANISRRKKR